jgi:hypothetical protein
VGQFLAMLKDYPPRQKAASFNLDKVMRTITEPTGHKQTSTDIAAAAHGDPEEREERRASKAMSGMGQ